MNTNEAFQIAIPDELVLKAIEDQGEEIVRQLESDGIDWSPREINGRAVAMRVQQPTMSPDGQFLLQYGKVTVKDMATGHQRHYPLAHRIEPEPRSHVSMPNLNTGGIVMQSLPQLTKELEDDVIVDLRQFIIRRIQSMPRPPIKMYGQSITIKGRYDDEPKSIIQQALHDEDTPMCLACGASWDCEHVPERELPSGNFINGEPGELLGNVGIHTRLQIEDMVDSGVVSEDDGAYMNGVLRGRHREEPRAWFNPWTDQPPADEDCGYGDEYCACSMLASFGDDHKADCANQ